MCAERVFAIIDGSPRIVVIRTQGSVARIDIETLMVDDLIDTGIQGFRHLLADWRQVDDYFADIERVIGKYAHIIDRQFDKIAVLAPLRMTAIVSGIKGRVSKTAIEQFDDEASALAWLRDGGG